MRVSRKAVPVFEDHRERERFVLDKDRLYLPRLRGWVGVLGTERVRAFDRADTTPFVSKTLTKAISFGSRKLLYTRGEKACGKFWRWK